MLTPPNRYRRNAETKARVRPHFPDLLRFVSDNRFAVASQIQRRFPVHLPSDRTARRHLVELEAFGYLGVAPTRSTSPLFPKVYFVTKAGLRVLHSPSPDGHERSAPIAAVQIPRPQYSADYVLHELWITEFLLAVWQTLRERPDLALLSVQRRTLKDDAAFRFGLNGKQTRLEPDALFVFRQAPAPPHACFVEMDRGTMNLRQLREKFLRYGAWATSEGGKRFLDTGHPAGSSSPAGFRIAVVTSDYAGNSDERRLQRLTATALTLPGGLRDRLWFTSVKALLQHQNESSPLGAAIWRRPRDFRFRERDVARSEMLHPLFPYPPTS